MFSLSRKLKADGNKCRNKWENEFLEQVAKEKVTMFVQFLSLQFIERNFFLFFMLLFLPLKYLNNKNNPDKGYSGKKIISLVTLSFGKLSLLKGDPLILKDVDHFSISFFFSLASL